MKKNILIVVLFSVIFILIGIIVLIGINLTHTSNNKEHNPNTKVEDTEKKEEIAEKTPEEVGVVKQYIDKYEKIYRLIKNNSGSLKTIGSSYDTYINIIMVNNKNLAVQLVGDKQSSYINILISNKAEIDNLYDEILAQENNNEDMKNIQSNIESLYKSYCTLYDILVCNNFELTTFNALYSVANEKYEMDIRECAEILDSTKQQYGIK